MARGKKAEAQQQQHGDANPEAEERKRLKKLAYRNNLLSHTPAATGFTPLSPSKTVIKHHGTDILKKSQRKNRYLFSFSGLIAPISGGKIGELTHLASKNPILYLDFPQGRMKLFGTIVHPKNRYLTLQFSRGGKNVICDDCFDTMIVFSDACWIGKKDENPDEARLDFPKELYEGKHSEFDFQGGAGTTTMRNKDVKKVVTTSAHEESPPESSFDDMDAESPKRQNDVKDSTNSTPVRHSERTAGKKFKFAEVSSDDNSAKSVDDMSEERDKEAAKSSKSCLLDQDPGTKKTAVEIHNSESIQQSAMPITEEAPISALSSSRTKASSRSSLVQATISTLFRKMEEKSTAGGARNLASNEVSHEKMQLDGPKLKNKDVKMEPVAQSAERRKEVKISHDRKAGPRSDKRKQKAEVAEVEDDIEEFSSASQETDGSDEDWHS